MVHCFAKRFNVATELVLEKLLLEMNKKIELYIRFGVYESPEDLRIELANTPSVKIILMTLPT